MFPIWSQVRIGNGKVVYTVQKSDERFSIIANMKITGHKRRMQQVANTKLHPAEGS